MRINEAVAAMEPPHYTTNQAAEKLNRSPETLVYWRKNGLYIPTESRHFGKTVVPLYTDGDIERMRELSKTFKPGRKKAS